MFFSMIFYKDKKGCGIWTVNPLFRIVMLCIFAITCISVLFTLREKNVSIKSGVSIMQTFFVLFSLLGTLYSDCCIFDVQTRTLICKTGFIFFCKQRLISFDNIASVHLITVHQGKRTLEFQCVLYSKEGNILADIEHVKKNALSSLKTKAQNAAALIGCPLEYTSL